jgi:hypothetical protein
MGDDEYFVPDLCAPGAHCFVLLIDELLYRCSVCTLEKSAQEQCSICRRWVLGLEEHQVCRRCRLR